MIHDVVIYIYTIIMHIYIYTIIMYMYIYIYVYNLLLYLYNNSIIVCVWWLSSWSYTCRPGPTALADPALFGPRRSMPDLLWNEESLDIQTLGVPRGPWDLGWTWAEFQKGKVPGFFFRKPGFYWFLLNIPRTEVVISGEGSTRCTTAVMESWKAIWPQAEVAAKDLVRFWPTIWCSIMGYQPCESTVTWHNTSELLRWRRFASFLWGGESWTAGEDQNGQNLLSLFTVKNSLGRYAQYTFLLFHSWKFI
jgi:hypothetical protein